MSQGVEDAIVKFSFQTGSIRSVSGAVGEDCEDKVFIPNWFD